MSVLADEFVRIRADTSYLAKDLKKQGRTSGDNLGKGILGGLKSIAGPVAGILAGLGVLKYLADATEAARESQKIGRQTAAVLKSTGGAAKVTQRDIENLSGSIAKKTGIDDEAIQSSANLLLTFTGVRNEVGKGNDIFNQATKTVQDMSVALGQDGKTSAIQLGKALNDPIAGVGALRRVGVSLTNQQKEQIKTLVEHGDKLGAQKIILAELSKEFGGSAEAQATWADKVQVAWGDVQETVGGFLNDTLEPIAKWFAEEGLPAVQDFFKKISTDKNIQTAVTNLKDALTTLTGDVDFRESLNSIAESIPPIVDGLTKIVTTYGQISAAVDKFENMSFAGGDDRGGPVGQIVKDFKPGGTIETALIYFRTAAPAWVERAWDDMTATFTQRANEAVAGVGRFVGSIVAWFVNMKTRVVAWVKLMWTEAKATFTQRIRELVAGVKKFFEDIKKLWGDATTWLSNKWTTFWSAVKKTSKDAITSVQSTLGSVLGAISRGFSRGVTAIGTAWDKIKAAVETPVKFVVNTILDDGILAAFRAISKLVGYAAGTNFHVTYSSSGVAPSARKAGGGNVGFASGGVLPGYTPGRDVHRFTSATGGVLDLSGGEGIMRPELVKAIGADRFNAANRAARVGDIDKGTRYLGGFAQGGTISGIDAAKRYARSIGITSIGTYPTHGTPNDPAHNWDFMTPNKATGDKMADWLWQNRRSIHLWYEIWYRRIRSMTREGAGWRPYTRSNPHTDHVHASWYSSALAGALSNITGGGGGGVDASKYLGMADAALNKLKGIGGGQFGQMVAAAARILGGKVKSKITDLAASFLGVGTGGPAGGFTAIGGGNNRAIGKRMMLQRWGAGEWPALNSLWTKESGWRTTARNPSSGAYGIPQSLPGSKMASAGSDWRTNPATQIKWGLGYIASRYGSPGAAWRHSQQTNWYGNGGVINEPVIGMGMRSGRSYGFGEHGPETVTPGRGGRGINILIDLGDGVTQRVQGILDENDEFKASVGRMR